MLHISMAACSHKQVRWTSTNLFLIRCNAKQSLLLVMSACKLENHCSLIAMLIAVSGGCILQRPLGHESKQFLGCRATFSSSCW